MGKTGSARLHLFPSRATLLGVAALLTCAASPALSEPIQITSGNVYEVASWTGYDPPFGFGFAGGQTSLGGITYSIGIGSSVSVGDTVSLSETISVSADPFRTGPFQQTVDGVTYNNVFLAGMLSFAADPATLTSDATDALKTPFTMNGSISLFAADPSKPIPAAEPFLIVPIEGRGTASLSLASRGGTLLESSLSYDFADPAVSPTPEPATLTLLGSGLVLAVARARGKGRSRG